MENEKVTLTLAVNLNATLEVIFIAYCGLLTSAVTSPNMSDQLPEANRIADVALLFRKIALKIRALLIANGADENDLIEVEKRIFNFSNADDVKKAMVAMYNNHKDD